MKNLKSDYFYFTKRERNGMLLLLGFALLFLALPTVIRKFRTVEKYDFQAYEQLMAETGQTKNIPIKIAPEKSPDLSSLNPKSIDINLADKEKLLTLGLSTKLVSTILNYRNKVSDFEKIEDLKKIYGMTESEYQRILPYVFIKPKLQKSPIEQPIAVAVSQPIKTNIPVLIQVPTQKFDPNTITKEELLSFGLPEKIVDRMIKFRNAGGKFRSPEDVKKVYGMKEEWVTQLLSWIEIIKPKKIDPEKINFRKKKTPKKENPITDINQASFEDWQKLSGIGPYYADKIMGYREKLGGFVSVDQILETNGLPDSVKQSILPALRPSDIFRKIKINSATTKEMAIHPYITWKEANAIFKYRKNHGSFESRMDLEKVVALKPELIDRIFPYLDFVKYNK